MKQVIPGREDTTMGRVNADVKVINDTDRILAEEGMIDSSEVREIEVEFLVDTGAAMLCLPTKLIQTLGLRKIEERPVMTANGHVTRGVYGGAV